MDYDGFFKQRLICSAVAEEGSDVRTAGPEDAGLTSSPARVGYRMTVVSSRGCLTLGASIGPRPAQNRAEGFPTVDLSPAVRAIGFARAGLEVCCPSS
jgi:hypothetical protein